MLDSAVSKQNAWQQTKRQIMLYAVIGGVQLGADWICFVAATWLGVAVIPANLSGRIFGAILGFWLNGRLTFAEDGRGRLGHTHAAKFATSWLVMSLLSTGAVWLTEQWAGIDGARVAKPFIDAALAGLGFLASKLWIYR